MATFSFPALLPRLLTLLLLSHAAILPLSAQVFGNEPLAHTYSIVAYDEATGEMGVAVQSHWFAVGSIVSWGEAGVGVVATQSFVNPTFGPDGLALLRTGLSPQEALDSLISLDAGEAVRQVAILSPAGAAAHTGSGCIRYASHLTRPVVSVQANMMLTDSVPAAMLRAFEQTTGPLEMRLLAALEGAEAAGGDIRGRQSAALLVVRAEATGQPWVDRRIDLRVDDAREPLAELRRLLLVHQAYEFMNAGDLAVEAGDFNAAMKAYQSAMTLQPGNEEMAYWTAVSLANTGRVDEALPLFQQAFRANENWRELTRRIRENKLLVVEGKDLRRILALE